MIRVAADTDSQLVQELWLAFNAEIPDAPWRDPDEDEFSPDLSLLADEDGLLSLRREGSRHFVVDVLYVRPEARGRGLARELMRAAAEHAREQGADVLELDVLEHNEAARQAYDRMGFTTVERRLAAPVDRLLGAPVEGPSYGAVHAQTDDVDAVRRNATKVLHVEPEVTLTGSWVRVDAELDRLRPLARELSYTAGVTVALSVEHGAVVRYVLFDRGSMVDEYASVPEFDGPLPPGDVIALGANPTVVARLTGADPQRVRAVARTASSPGELPPAEELYESIAEVLGLEVR
ncbi:MAG TPA: GNAT family N-acetyltransferase [Gaiellaceae bacterium]|nr:GNAT family N-acetyltransferase [Gaiellaceae bacterium]